MALVKTRMVWFWCTLTAEYVRMVSDLAYLWAWPMVNLHTRKVTFEKVPQAFYKGGIVPIAPPNHLCMLTDYIQPQEREVACPNQDVAYEFGPFDFEKDADHLISSAFR